MQIDDDIQEVEHRLAQRRVKVELLARAASRRTVNTIVSPAGIAIAAGVGFLAVAGVMRRRPKVIERRRRPGKSGILGSVAGLAATVGLQLLRSQLGSPAQIAQRALQFFKRKSSPGDIRQAQHGVRFGG